MSGWVEGLALLVGSGGVALWLVTLGYADWRASTGGEPNATRSLGMAAGLLMLAIGLMLGSAGWLARGTWALLALLAAARLGRDWHARPR